LEQQAQSEKDQNFELQQLVQMFKQQMDRISTDMNTLKSEMFILKKKLFPSEEPCEGYRTEVDLPDVT
jgi:hypothetical protein